MPGILLNLISKTIYCKIVNPIQTGGGGGGEGGRGGLDATQELNPYYSRTIVSTVFPLRDFSSNSSGNNLLLSCFGG